MAECAVTIGHNWDAGQVTTNPTCTVAGEKTYTCTTCITATSREAVSALGHNFSDEWTEDKAVSCTEAGSKSHHCTRTNCTEKSDMTAIEAKGHKYVATVTKESTVEEEGIRTYTCESCKHSYTESIPKLPKPAHQHEYVSQVTKAATCTELGTATYSCTCGDSYTESIEAIGHKWSEWKVITPATATEDGEEQRTCEHCHETESQAIPKTGEIVTPELPGDVNDDGQVNLADVQIALKAALRIITLDEDRTAQADVDGNGQITLTDARIILKKALKIIP